MTRQEPRHPPLIYRPDLQPRRQRLVFSALTAAAWGIWLYLFLPLFSVLAWWFGGDLFARHILGPEDRGHLLTLLGYAGVVVIAAVVIVTWSWYNLKRYGGMDRRKPIVQVTDEDLCARFQVDGAMLASLRTGRRLELDLDEHGHIITARDQSSVDGSASRFAAASVRRA